jgi:hypothetical protein
LGIPEARARLSKEDKETLERRAKRLMPPPPKGRKRSLSEISEAPSETAPQTSIGAAEPEQNEVPLPQKRRLLDCQNALACLQAPDVPVDEDILAQFREGVTSAIHELMTTADADQASVTEACEIVNCVTDELASLAKRLPHLPESAFRLSTGLLSDPLESSDRLESLHTAQLMAGREEIPQTQPNPDAILSEPLTQVTLGPVPANTSGIIAMTDYIMSDSVPPLFTQVFTEAILNRPYTKIEVGQHSDEAQAALADLRNLAVALNRMVDATVPVAVDEIAFHAETFFLTAVSIGNQAIPTIREVTERLSLHLADRNDPRSVDHAFEVISVAVNLLAAMKQAGGSEPDSNVFRLVSDSDESFVELLNNYATAAGRPAHIREAADLINLQTNIQHFYEDGQSGSGEDEVESGSGVQGFSTPATTANWITHPSLPEVEYRPEAIFDVNENQIAVGYRVRIPLRANSERTPVEMLAFTLPGVDGAADLRPAQIATKCSIHTLNYMNWRLTRDIGLMVDGGELETVTRGRMSANRHVKTSDKAFDAAVERESTHFPVMDLVAYNNRNRKNGYPPLQSVNVIYGDGQELREVGGNASTPLAYWFGKINKAPVVGITLNFWSEQGPMPHTVAIERGGDDIYWLVDWRRPTDELISSQTMVDAIAAVCKQYGFAGKGEVDVFFPMT